jgi:hypothetical protein
MREFAGNPADSVRLGIAVSSCFRNSGTALSIFQAITLATPTRKPPAANHSGCVRFRAVRAIISAVDFIMAFKRL